MSGRFSRSWALFGASFRVMASQPGLLTLPFLAFLGTAAAAAAVNFGVAEPIGLHNLFSGPPSDPAAKETWEVEHFAVLYLFFFSGNLVVTFFGVAMASAVLARFRGDHSSAGSGIASAVGMVGPIVVYAGLSAVLSVVRSFLRERGGAAGRVASDVVGIGAGIATFLINPVMAAERVNAFIAVKRSAMLLRETWGENIISGAAFGLLFFVVMLVLAVVGGIPALFLYSQDETRAMGVAAIVILVLIFIFLMVLQSALVNIYRAGLYHYAVHGTLPEGFSADQIEHAFRKKGAPAAQT